jgi:DNA-binding PadR family transcriptional regulator
MPDKTRISFQTLKVLKPFLANPRVEITGTEVMRVSGLASGTAYPIMLRLERLGFLTSHWESGDPRDLGRPRRRYYRITVDGVAIARHALGEITPVAAELTAEVAQ